MATRGRDADDMIASLMQEMGHHQGYKDDSTHVGVNLEDEDARELSDRSRRPAVLAEPAQGALAPRLH